MAKTRINSIYACINVLNVITHWSDDTIFQKNCIALPREVIMATNPQEAVLVHCKSPRLMTTENYCSIVENQCFMTARDILAALFGKHFSVYIADFMAKPRNFLKLLKDFFASNATPESYMRLTMNCEGWRQIGRTRNRAEIMEMDIRLSPFTVRFQNPQEKSFNPHDPLRNMDKRSKQNWQRNLTIPHNIFGIFWKTHWNVLTYL